MTIRQTLLSAAFSAAIAFAAPMTHAENPTPTGAQPARNPAGAAPAGHTTANNNSLAGGAQQQSSSGANNNAGRGQQAAQNKTGRVAPPTTPSRNTRVAMRETKLVTSPNVVGTSSAVFVPYFGYAPINGFDYTTNYAGWNPNYDYTAAEALTETPNNGGSTTPPAASPSAATTNPEADAARNEMVTIQNRMMKDLSAKPEYQQALADVRKSAEEFNAAVAQANNSVSDTSQVKSAEAKARDAQRKLDSAQQASHVIAPSTQPSGEVAAGSFSPGATKAAQQKLEAKTQIKQTQNTAAGKDPAVLQAREKFQAAVTRMNEVRSKYEADVLADKDWQAAHAKLDAATAGKQ